MSFIFSQPAPGIVPIDSISFAELAKVDASSVLGNPSGSLADASSITFTNLTSLLDPFAGTLQGLVPASSNTGTLFLRDDGTWVAAGGVTNVTATAPLASSGGLTPDISISQADSTTDGYLSSVDWNTFDSKQPAGDYITDLTGEVTASGPGSVSATIAGQSGNGTKVLATNGTTVSWQYAGLGDGSFGTGNVILGRAKPASITSATGNVLLGASAGNNITTASDCFLVNANAYLHDQSGDINVLDRLRVLPIISCVSLGSATVSSGAVIIGHSTGGSGQGVCIGKQAGLGMFAVSIGDRSGSSGIGTGTVAVGSQTGEYGVSQYSVAIGYTALKWNGSAGTGQNTAIGNASLHNNSGSYNLGLGTNTLYTSTSQNNLVGIGAFAGYRATTSNEFYLDSRSSALATNALEKTNSLMYGQFNATPSSQTLTINAEVTATYGVAISTEGKGLAIKTGANAKIGTVTMPGTNPNIVSVSTSAVTANSMIFITAQTPDGGLATPLYIESKTVGFGFEIKTTDNSYSGDVGWMIVEATP